MKSYQTKKTCFVAAVKTTKAIYVPCLYPSTVSSLQEGQRLDERSFCVAFTSAASTWLWMIAAPYVPAINWRLVQGATRPLPQDSWFLESWGPQHASRPQAVLERGWTKWTEQHFSVPWSCVTRPLVISRRGLARDRYVCQANVTQPIYLSHVTCFFPFYRVQFDKSFLSTNHSHIFLQKTVKQKANFTYRWGSTED